MTKKKKIVVLDWIKKIALFSAIALAVVKTSVAFADMILPNIQPPASLAPGQIAIQALVFIGIFCVDLIIDFFVLCAGYFILKQGALIRSIKFLKYSLTVAVGGILIDLIYLSPQWFYGITMFWGSGPCYLWHAGPLSNGMIVFNLLVAFVIFLLLGVFNYWLSRKFFNLTRLQAVVIGLIVGVLTNPVILSIPAFFHCWNVIR